ncbi:sodium:solute symporter family protein [Parvicella tangerina]|uniref:Osmoregulated proline transporter OpuE n=1 Tax=Parvicella tangerina TaxID=2829795 RepID=A0A916JNH1_9FLAO|nr:sodium:solute symporter family protein [Parvicella tangerina]CAG5083941.1 Osmoregulated proline transporter OpuE [Parvicella tangerina]
MSLHWIDLTIFIVYLAAMLGVGFYFMKRNQSDDDYYVGGRGMSAGHIGFSVVATDVGGGFSIGLGGLGFLMGLSGTWMLFTGLIGAWLSAVILIPKVYPIARKHNFLSFPDALKHHYNLKVAKIAGLISLIGYIGFTSSQILAGAKLASATFPAVSITDAVIIMGVIAVIYTVLGGIKAVIYTDTVQWILLLSGLIFIGIPLGYSAIGGWENIQTNLPSSYTSLTNLSASDIINWFITIVPIWFVGMTLYQRIYACKDEKTAKKAWKVAGFFEWPFMAFMGVLLGLFAKVAFEQGMFTQLGYAPGSEMDPELGLPLFLREILPIGLMGLMLSAYFSAIMSTADSCLMAASGNLTNDILENKKERDSKKQIRFSQWITLAIGVLAILLATMMNEVLELMLYSYAFMVSGLLVPVLGMLFLKKPSAKAALVAMIGGGLTTLSLLIMEIKLPWDLDANIVGISVSLISFLMVQRIDNSHSLKR